MRSRDATATVADPRLPGYLPLTASQVAYHLRLLMRSPRSLLAGVLLPVLVLLMHGLNGSGDSDTQTRLVAGLAVLGAVSTSYVTHANSLVIARESGVLRRWQANPVPPACFFVGKTAATVLTALASALATVLSADLLGITTNPAAAVCLLVPLAAGAVVWSLVGTAVSGFIPTASAAYPLLTLTYLPITILSGAMGSMTGEPSWLHDATSYLPVQPVLDAAAAAMQHHSLSTLVQAQPLALLAGWTAVATFTALVTFRWAPRSG
jgi:ABC-2 type transport system permease protein